MEDREDDESIDDNESLPDLLDDPVINDPLEGGREIDDNPVINQRERWALEQRLLEEMGYHFEEDKDPMDDPEIMQAYENRVNNGQNPEGTLCLILLRSSAFL